MPQRVKDYSGRRFGRLLVVALVPREVGDGNARWICRCDCGNAVVYDSGNLPLRRSCGKCVNPGAEAGRKHGHCAAAIGMSPEYRSWVAMRTRCHSVRASDYARYGGRGITVCQRWRDSFVVFLEDVGPKPSRAHTLDRIDNDGNYEPGNVRWATPTEQSNNRRNNRLVEYRGQRLTVGQLAKLTGVSRGRLYGRLNAGWPVEDAVAKPARSAIVHSSDLARFANLAQ